MEGMHSLNIVKYGEARPNRTAPTCLAYEYETSVGAINGAVIELSGRYPESGWALNMECTSLVHIVDGTGRIMSEDGETALVAGDQILIAPEEKYIFDGNMKLLYIATPSWTASQARNVT